jgi:hypothetical protein
MMDPDAIALFRELADRSLAERQQYYANHHVTEAATWRGRVEVETLTRESSPD